MSHKPRAEMIEETRTKLIRAARQQFGKAGYAATVMDDLTAQAGLTRGRCIITLVIKRAVSGGAAGSGS